jgi:hypothetical protein
MRPEGRWAVAAVAAFAVGATCADGYARIAAPYYRMVTSVIATAHPWKVTDVRVTDDDSSPAKVLLLTGEVRAHRDDSNPAALVTGRVQTGAAIETPLVFWTVLLMWPGMRWTRIALGIPLFLLLEAAMTPCQLMYAMSRAAAMLAGASDPLTGWERWSHFLDGGGRFALEAALALVTIAIPRMPSRGGSADRPCSAQDAERVGTPRLPV